MKLCAWLPSKNRARKPNERAHAPATVSMRGEIAVRWDLCADCAALPQFANLRKVPLPEERTKRLEATA